VSTLDHVTITVADLARSLDFYDAALGALGLHRVRELVDEEEDDAAVEAAAWGIGPTPMIWLVTGTRPTNGAHLALRTDSRVEVETFYWAGLQAGGGTHSAPRRWMIYRRGEFNAILADPDGNLVEAICAE
jgi:catechol 2,3-dioxygenase-like lactoylglutathione lyase family enzyme